ncbi:hypothetical protein L1987_02674 [Smallanthus sonchifolius]|uniref:Uncharacterized protein n=1 Tax=Smallanthus sonchifolius TaxID=185202 RepID=A0ACB9K8D3_9ASTR|nr:hypothetical protein L1987_02674 [Smallanthus sonchifolius]
MKVLAKTNLFNPSSYPRGRDFEAFLRQQLRGNFRSINKPVKTIKKKKEIKKKLELVLAPQELKWLCDEDVFALERMKILHKSKDSKDVKFCYKCIKEFAEMRRSHTGAQYLWFYSCYRDANVKNMAPTIVVDVENPTEETFVVSNYQRRCKTRADCNDFCPPNRDPFCVDFFCACARRH